MPELAVTAPSPHAGPPLTLLSDATVERSPDLSATLGPDGFSSPRLPTDVEAPRKRRGIQPGMVAGDAMARTLDLALKSNAEAVFNALVAENPVRGRYFCWGLGLSGADVQAWYATMMNTVDGLDPMAGCAPDGGLVFEKLHGRDGATVLSPVLLIEGKKQQDAGNAHERWYKNAALLRDLNPDVALLTFLVGDGAAPDGVMSRTFQQTLLHQGARKAKRTPDLWNTFYGQGASFYRKVEGFSSDGIRAVLRLAMTTVMDHIVAQRQREDGVTIVDAGTSHPVRPTPAD